MPTTAADAYPVARFERSPATGAPTPVIQRAAIPPRSRHFSLETGSQAGSRTTVSTPRLVGPVIVQSIVWKHRTAADPPTHSLEIGWASFDVRETQVALTASKPWNAISQKLTGIYTILPPPPAVHITQVNTAGASYIEQYEVPILLTAPELFLTITYSNYGLVNPNSGWVEIWLLEAVSPEVAANFH